MEYPSNHGGYFFFDRLEYYSAPYMCMIKRRNGKELTCDLCGINMLGHKEFNVRNEVWEKICYSFPNTNIPKETILCPECITKLLGHKPRVEELTNHGIIFPINWWYIEEEYPEKMVEVLVNYSEYYRGWAKDLRKKVRRAARR